MIPPPNSGPGTATKTYTLNDLKIRTKSRVLTRFVPNEVQEAYLAQLKATYPGFDHTTHAYSMRGAREDVLKARQQGFSTLLLALIFLDTLNNPLTQSIIIADTGERAELLFRICHRFWEHLPDPRPKKKYSTKREMEFVALDSLISIGTAGQTSVGRGGTINNCLMSERAYWADGDIVEVGLMEAIPAHGNVYRETTANGLNDYYRERQLEHRGESPFHPRFFGWNLTHEYVLPVPDQFHTTSEEAELAVAFSLKDEQLVWRREKLRVQRDNFTQEYPLYEAEAFLSSGNPYFDAKTLESLSIDLERKEHDPLPNLVIPKDDYPRLRNAYHGSSLKIWSIPKDGHSYVIGADTAMGLDSRRADYDAASVFDVETWEQVAVLHGKWDTRLYGELLAELGWLYNDALLCVEQNNHGHAVINAIIGHGYPLQRGSGDTGLYMHDARILGDTRHTNPDTRQAGWPETAKSKAFALDKLSSAILDGDVHLHDRDTVAEMRTFVRTPTGVGAADGAAKDDRVIAAALGAVMLSVRFEKGRRYKDIVLPQPDVQYALERPRG